MTFSTSIRNYKPSTVTNFSFLQRRIDFINMEISDEEVPDKTSTPIQQFTTDQINEFLRSVGLIHAVDFVFLDYAQMMNRKNIAKTSENDLPLQFMFEVVLGAKEGDREFPYSTFLELAHRRVISAETGNEECFDRYIMYSLKPSPEWPDKQDLPFTDFHLYYIDIIKPMTNQSAEEFYALLDTKKGETYFLTLGKRGVSEFLVILFIRADRIVTFHIPEKEILPSTYSYFCKWISLEVPALMMFITEHASFHLPEGNLVLSDSGVQKHREQWQEAFGNPDLMDERYVSISNETKINDPLSVTQILEDDACEMCGA
jgi:hypothetical protein